jgi:molecular chaperone GrpE
VTADPGKGPSEDAVRGQMREERGRVADDSGRDNGARADEARAKRAAAEQPDAPEESAEDAVAKVEAARSAEARMATESASAIESADAAGRGAEPDQGQTDRGDLSTAAAPEDDVRAERDRYLDLARRTQADFDNYRKRAAKDAAAAGTRAKAGLVRELLPVVDNLERAIASAGEGDSLVEGVKLVHADVVGVLERNGILSQEPTGAKFDPTEHEAVSMRTEEGADPGIVLDVVEKGYKLGDTIIRPARVVVSG